MAGTEVTIQRLNTIAFIKANPLTIALVPHTKAKTANGGFTMLVGVPREEQIMRLIPQSTTAGAPLRATDGVERRWPYVLLGQHDAIMAIGDTFTLDGATYAIEYIWPENGYERRAGVSVG